MDQNDEREGELKKRGVRNYLVCVNVLSLSNEIDSLSLSLPQIKCINKSPLEYT